MAFISVNEDWEKKSFTDIQNRFITKYLPILDGKAVQIYLYAQYVAQNSKDITLEEFANVFQETEEEIRNYFTYLEEFELVQVISLSPLQIKICNCENISGTPKKIKPEKYSDFTKGVQNIIKGRMISANEFMEYFYLIEEYGFEQNALLMIISYCASLKGDNIRLAYIKKVSKSFAEEGLITTTKVEQKLSAYSTSTPALLRLYNAIGSHKQPDLADEELYNTWLKEFGFTEDAILFTAKAFKVKTTEKLNDILQELFKNKKFDVKEIANFAETQNIAYTTTIEIAKSLGLYIQNATPYIQNFVNRWINLGFETTSLTDIADYCFISGNNSFDAMDSFVTSLYNEGIITVESITEKLLNLAEKDKFIKTLLKTCGMTRKILPFDRECLNKWKDWGLSDDKILDAAKLASGKNNPIAYMNGILSSWKDKNDNGNHSSSALDLRAIELHYADLRQKAESKAESVKQKALQDVEYATYAKQLNSLNIKYAFAIIRDENLASELEAEISTLKENASARLKKLHINEEEFTPHYSCQKCNDTGYDKAGKQCDCLKRLIATNQV